MYDNETKEKERNDFLLIKHEIINDDGMAEEADLSRIFELNIAHKMATEQRKNLAFLEDTDSEKQLLFKHYETLKRYKFNINQFSEQIKLAIREESESMGHLLSSTHLQGTQLLLEDVYKGSEDMSANLKQLMDMTRSTIDGIANATAPATGQKDQNPEKSFDMNKVQLDKSLYQAVTKSHEVMETLIKDLDGMIRESEDFLSNFSS